MPLSRRLALTEEQIEDIMTASWNCRIGTIGPGQRINITPMWFGWAGGKVYIYGRGQKVANLRRDSTCTVIVDRNERFPELQAIMMQGQATVLVAVIDAIGAALQQQADRFQRLFVSAGQMQRQHGLNGLLGEALRIGVHQPANGLEGCSALAGAECRVRERACRALPRLS